MQQAGASQPPTGFMSSERLEDYQKQIVAQSGILGSSFSDLVRSPKWLKNIFLLALLRLIPIYNLACFGRIAQFGVGNSEGLQQLSIKDMDKNSFKAGLASILGGILFGIISGGLLLMLWPLHVIGLLIWPVLMFFLQAWMVLSVARSVVTNKLVAGLDISEIFSATSKHKGQLLLAVWVPIFIQLFIALIFMSILLLVLLFATFSIGSGLIESAMRGSVGSVGEYVLAIISVMGVFSVFGLIGGAFISCFIDCWMYRAVGRWIDAHAPHWRA